MIEVDGYIVKQKTGVTNRSLTDIYYKTNYIQSYTIISIIFPFHAMMVLIGCMADVRKIKDMNMEATVIVLVLASASIHTGWNVMTKNNPKQSMFMEQSLYMSLIPILPLAFWYYPLWTFIPLSAVGFMLVSGFFQFLYFHGLASSYSKHDISFIYPLIRSIPIIFITFILNRTGEAIAWTTWVGIVLIICGSTLLVVAQIAKHPPLAGDRKSLLFAVAPVVVSIIGYTVSDAKGLATMVSTGSFSSFSAAGIFLFGEVLVAVLFYLGWNLIDSNRRTRDRQGITLRSLSSTFINGLCINLSYILILIAFSITSRAGYVTVLRQVSIPLSAIAGIILFHESASPRKILAIAILLGGVFCAGIA